MSQLSYREYIHSQKDKIHAVLGALVGGDPVAIVDFPDIRNVGDSAIWVGEIAYLKDRHGKAPSYVSRLWDYSSADLRKTMPEGPIFIHGGGNFGDIWVAHQNFREHVLKEWKGRQIIQFPQSIHFNDLKRADATARIVAAHGNFVLLVRDEESRFFAEKHFDCKVQLCPDMAFCIGEVAASEPTIPLLAMLREDRERVKTRESSAPLDCPVEDWITEPMMPIKLAKFSGYISELASFDRVRMRRGMFTAAANQRFQRGIRQIGRARAIVTDRLHVHIISLLLGRPHAVLDNSYGKITRFMEAFPGGMDLTYRARSLADAMEWARARLQ